MLINKFLSIGGICVSVTINNESPSYRENDNFTTEMISFEQEK